MDDFDHQYKMLMDRLDGITSEIYTVGAMEERATMTQFLQSLILEKDLEHDYIAVEVLGWALERLSVAN
jgi:hypothetical protein